MYVSTRDKKGESFSRETREKRNRPHFDHQSHKKMHVRMQVQHSLLGGRRRRRRRRRRGLDEVPLPEAGGDRQPAQGEDVARLHRQVRRRRQVSETSRDIRLGQLASLITCLFGLELGPRKLEDLSHFCTIGGSFVKKHVTVLLLYALNST